MLEVLGTVLPLLGIAYVACTEEGAPGAPSAPPGYESLVAEDLVPQQTLMLALRCILEASHFCPEVAIPREVVSSEHQPGIAKAEKGFLDA